MINQILYHYSILQNSEARSILDVDAYLEKEKLITRDYCSCSINPDARMDALQLTRFDFLSIYNVLYDHIYTLETLGNTSHHYDVCIVETLMDCGDADARLTLLKMLLPTCNLLIIHTTAPNELEPLLAHLAINYTLNQFPPEEYFYLISRR